MFLYLSRIQISANQFINERKQQIIFVDLFLIIAYQLRWVLKLIKKYFFDNNRSERVQPNVAYKNKITF